MEDLANKMGWQKVAIIGGILAVIIIIFAIFSFISAGRKTGNKSTTNNSGNSNNNSEQDQGVDQFKRNVITPTVFPTGSDFGSTVTVLKPYSQSKNYTISYPTNWKTNQIPVVGGGTQAHFAFPAANGREDFPRIDIQVVPITDSTISIQDMINNLSYLNLNRDTTEFRGMNVDRLSGTLPINFATSDPLIALKVNKTYLFFDKNGYRYVVDYAYFLNGSETNSLEVINKALDTLEFK